MTDDESKRIILSRRARFVAAALASAGLAVNPACGGNTDDGSDNGGTGSGGQARDASRDRNDEPQVCLQPPGGFGGAGAVGGAGGTTPLDAPMPCLGVTVDAQVDATDARADAPPQPCLSPPAPETGTDAGPQPCLEPVP